MKPTKKLIVTFGLASAILCASGQPLLGQAEPTSDFVSAQILGDATHRNELGRLEAGIVTVLADTRLTNNSVREMLAGARSVLLEMTQQNSAANAFKLFEFAKWMRLQGEAKYTLWTSQEPLTPEQEFTVGNPLAGGEVYLVSLLTGILRSNLEFDKNSAGPLRLEALCQIYLFFRPILERAPSLADEFLLRVPTWIQARFTDLTTEQRRQFLSDVNSARAERGLGPAADEVPVPPPTAAELAAYEAAYQFVVLNTP